MVVIVVVVIELMTRIVPSSRVLTELAYGA
jgi:hypothetical protein